MTKDEYREAWKVTYRKELPPKYIETRCSIDQEAKVIVAEYLVDRGVCNWIEEMDERWGDA